MPKLAEGKQVTISAPASPELKRFVEQLVARTEDIKTGKVDPREDNMLKITSEGRKAALDLRLMVPHLADNPDSKVNQAVANVHRIWEKTAPVKGTQMVFCNLSTPSAENRGNFNVYADVRSTEENLLCQADPHPVKLFGRAVVGNHATDQFLLTGRRHY